MFNKINKKETIIAGNCVLDSNLKGYKETYNLF